MYKAGLSIVKKQNSRAFTIVELLVVIVVVGILATITIVSYSGISTRAKIASLQSDLANSAKQLKMFYVDNGYYPATISIDCSLNPTNTTNLCLRPSGSNSFTSTPYVRPNMQSFGLTATNGTLSYYITENSTPTVGVYITPTLAVTDPANWMAIGAQVWAKNNLNTGTMILGSVWQSNNSIIEKHCYNNLESNCVMYGALYSWDEAMQYVTTNGAKGVCPAGTHIPTDNDWKILEIQIGMTPAVADTSSWRGVNEGLNMKNGGASGFNLSYSGVRFTDGLFYSLSEDAMVWSSTGSGINAWARHLNNTTDKIARDLQLKDSGYSIRCLAD